MIVIFIIITILIIVTIIIVNVSAIIILIIIPSQSSLLSAFHIDYFGRVGLVNENFHFTFGGKTVLCKMCDL